MGRDFWLVWGIGPLAESRQTVTGFSQSFHLLHLHQANWNKRMVNQTHTTDHRQFNILRHWLFAGTHWLHGKTSLSSESIESITTTFFRYQPKPAANTETFDEKIFTTMTVSIQYVIGSSFSNNILWNILWNQNNPRSWGYLLLADRVQWPTFVGLLDLQPPPQTGQPTTQHTNTTHTIQHSNTTHTTQHHREVHSINNSLNVFVNSKICNKSKFLGKIH